MTTHKRKRNQTGADGPMRKKRSQSAARDSRLFALLMAEHEATLSDICAFPALHFPREEYRKFLRAQSNHSDALCPYKRAVAMVEGRA